ncbi:MAG TPA: NIPSNAP family protein [Gemmataceae bacterium]|jgi:hypothetical protein
MKNLWCLLAVLGFGAVVAVASYAEQKEKDVKKADTRIFELRTYYAASGKMDALNARFRDHTCKLFKKHGMEIVAFWNPSDPKDADKKLIYVLAFPSKEAADKSWKAFGEDPEWIKVKGESEKDGKLVDKIESVYMNPTDYSPMK